MFESPWATEPCWPMPEGILWVPETPPSMFPSPALSLSPLHLRFADHLSVCPSFHPFVHLSVRPSIHPRELKLDYQEKAPGTEISCWSVEL